MDIKTRFIHYRDVLAKDYQQRQEINPSFSLGAYAQKIGLGISHLSRILDGKRGLSLEKAKEVVAKIGFDEERKELFLTLVEYWNLKNEEEGSKFREKLSKEAKNDEVASPRQGYLSKWYTPAIMAILGVPDLNPSIASLSKALEIKESEVEEGLALLIESGLVQKEKDFYELVKKSTHAENKERGEDIQKYHQAYLEKARTAVIDQLGEKREFASTVFAVSEEDLGCIKEKVKEMSFEFQNFIRSLDLKNNEKNKVYQMGLQLFEVGSIREKN